MSNHPSVLFVCLGNICRSAAAEAVLGAAAEKAGLSEAIEIDSAGTGDWHVGELADPRMRAAAQRRGLELTSRARQIEYADLKRFDLVVAMDRTNLRDIRKLGGDVRHADIRLLSSFLEPGTPKDVPDPYYGGPEGFDVTLDMLEAAAPGILAVLGNR